MRVINDGIPNMSANRVLRKSRAVGAGSRSPGIPRIVASKPATEFLYPQNPSPSFAGSTRESMFATGLVGSMDCWIKSTGVRFKIRSPLEAGTCPSLAGDWLKRDTVRLP
jgi:hypothetical protein